MRRLHLEDTPTQWVQQHRYLGVIIDDRLSWRPALASVRRKSLSLLKYVAALTARGDGIDQTTALQRPHALRRIILSKAGDGLYMRDQRARVCIVGFGNARDGLFFAAIQLLHPEEGAAKNQHAPAEGTGVDVSSAAARLQNPAFDFMLHRRHRAARRFRRPEALKDRERDTQFRCRGPRYQRGKGNCLMRARCYRRDVTVAAPPRGADH
ncbi:hypothetical protein HPB52_011276 [Rhipicephalus sanguineus]|uniref:Uncharacterized protein n=1 Tax=Rhipicephalus sanguineus TaxID=34632 RepID=A0A9D4T9L3_RHISA|nr:hypothetical protein HPB52_011276 [Rhipicephalus sanguineus]